MLVLGKLFDAVSISRPFTVSGVNVESLPSIKAAAPLTTAVAMLVPLSL